MFIHGSSNRYFHSTNHRLATINVFSSSIGSHYFSSNYSTATNNKASTSTDFCYSYGHVFHGSLPSSCCLSTISSSLCSAISSNFTVVGGRCSTTSAHCHSSSSSSSVFSGTSTTANLISTETSISVESFSATSCCKTDSLPSDEAISNFATAHFVTSGSTTGGHSRVTSSTAQGYRLNAVASFWSSVPKPNHKACGPRSPQGKPRWAAGDCPAPPEPRAGVTASDQCSTREA